LLKGDILEINVDHFTYDNGMKFDLFVLHDEDHTVDVSNLFLIDTCDYAIIQNNQVLITSYTHLFDRMITLENKSEIDNISSIKNEILNYTGKLRYVGTLDYDTYESQIDEIMFGKEFVVAISKKSK
jgi:hypothetical protein